jgi:serine/threonine protein kinase
MGLSASEMLQNRYRIISLLGQGGMGAVYHAWDTRLNAPIALKEMIPQPGLDPHTLNQLRRQLQKEANVLARLNHPHLVRVTDFFEERGSAYLAMDFVEGESLADRIARQGPLPEANALAWAGQLLDALGYCHSQSVIHRDVKPQNIIIRSDGQATLVDFGLVNWGGSAEAWSQVRKLTASDAAVGDYFGWSVGISGDTVVAGAYQDNHGGNDWAGSAYVFERNQGGMDQWGRVAKVTAGDAAADDYFGQAVGISGNTLVVGAYGDDDGGDGSGSAYVYRWTAARVYLPLVLRN